MNKQIGWYKEVNDKFFCNDCLPKTEDANKEGYKPVYMDDLDNNIYTCDKCRKEEKKSVKSTFAKIIQIIGWFLVMGSIVINIFAFTIEHPSGVGIGFFLFFGLPLIIIGLLFICLGKIRFKNKILNLVLAIILICLIFSLVLRMFNISSLSDTFENLTREKGSRVIEEVVETKNVKKCFEIRPVHFLPQFVFDFLFPWPDVQDPIFNLQQCCISIVAALEKDESICDEAKSLTRYSGAFEKCISKVASVKGDISLCEGFRENDCLLPVAIFTKDKSLCDNLGSYRGFCISQIKIRELDDSSCNKTGNEDEEKYCQIMATIKLAVMEKNINICKEMPLSFSGPDLYDCYREVAVAKKDPNLCRRMSSAYYYSNCLSEVYLR